MMPIGSVGLFDVDRLERRLMEKIEFDLNGGCWLWVGDLNGAGYGRIWIGQKGFSAHRVSKVVFHGAEMDGVLALHKCDVRCCINPDHIFTGNHQDNSDDMHRKGRGKSMPGEQNPNSSLTSQQAREIFCSRERGVDLARKYGISPGIVSSIRTGKAWTKATKEITNV